MSERVDIVVVGGGPVGIPAALALADDGWRVALIERAGPVSPPEDPLAERCTALAHASVAWLEARGLWDAEAARAAAIRRVHVSQRGHFGATRLDAREEGVDALGQVIENRAWLAALWSRLEPRGVQLVDGAHFEALVHEGDHLRITARRGDASLSLQARLVIAADGVGSPVRRALGIDTRRVDHEQTGLLFCATLAHPTEGRAFERFTAEGATAFLPRPGAAMNVVRCVSPASAAHLLALDDTAALAELAPLAEPFVGALRAVGPRAAQTLCRIEAERQIDRRVVLLGNAARLLHPVAGQGYNLALRDLAALVARLAGERDGSFDAFPRRVEDPGAARLLRAFVQERRRDQRETVWLVDTLARGFRGDNPLLGALRGAALAGLDLAGPLRHLFARRCMGHVA